MKRAVARTVRVRAPYPAEDLDVVAAVAERRNGPLDAQVLEREVAGARACRWRALLAVRDTAALEVDVLEDRHVPERDVARSLRSAGVGDVDVAVDRHFCARDRLEDHVRTLRARLLR